MLSQNINLENKTVLITGAAGFIGANLVKELLKSVSNVIIIGIDNLNDYYDVSLKEHRLNVIKSVENDVKGKFLFFEQNIAQKDVVMKLFRDYQPDIVVNLAAQAGVRYSITNPDVYIESNLVGFYNILEACRNSYKEGSNEVKHLIYASSSSVYGSNKKIPYSTEDKVDNPVSLYAATKKSNELMAHAYSKLYGIPSTGLRFFTVYGPAGRPDMAYFGFTDKLVNDQKIQIFNYGNCKRDFTYIDDIVLGVKTVMKTAPEENTEGVRYKVYNIGNHSPENLVDFVHILYEQLLEEKVLPADFDLDGHMEFVGMQPGDVEITYADVADFEHDFGFSPETPLKKGLHEFVRWYKTFYGK